jgi:hypothetical protein
LAERVLALLFLGVPAPPKTPPAPALPNEYFSDCEIVARLGEYFFLMEGSGDNSTIRVALATGDISSIEIVRLNVR